MIEPLVLPRKEITHPDVRQPIDERVHVDVITSIGEFAGLREQWGRLADSADVSPFQSFDWSFLWWKYLGPRTGRTLQILTFSGDNGLIGIAPLLLDNNSMAGIPLLRRLRFLACDIGTSGPNPYREYPMTDYLDFIVLPEYEEAVVSAFARYLRDERDSFDEVQLVNLRRGSCLLRWLVPKLDELGMEHELRHGPSCPYASVHGSMDEYYGSLDGNHRRRIRQAMKAAGEEAMFAIKSVSAFDEASEVFSELVRLHQKRWNRQGFPGLFADTRFERFQREFMDVLFRRGQLWLKSARAGSRVLAVRLAIECNGTLYDYLSGVDDEAPETKRRPGLALLATMICDAAERGHHTVDFLRGMEQYKLQLCTGTETLWNIRIISPQAAPWRLHTFRQFQRSASLLDRVRRELQMVKTLARSRGWLSGGTLYAESLVARLRASIHMKPPPSPSNKMEGNTPRSGRDKELTMALAPGEDKKRQENGKRGES